MSRKLTKPLWSTTGVFAGIILFAAVRQGPAAPVSLVIGTWRGTSVCVDHVKDPFCRDEVVIYDVDTISAPHGTVMLHADKVVNGVRDSMGTIPLSFQPQTKAWWSEFTTPRFHGRWSFQVHGSDMNGSLLELPGERLVRRVSVHRD